MNKTEEAAIVICAIGFVGPHGGAKRHEEFRADDPVVRSAPNHFVPSGTLESSWPTPWDRVVAENDAIAATENQRRLDAAKANKVHLDTPRVFYLKADLLDLEEGRTVERGSRLLENDPLIARFPDGLFATETK